MTRHWTDDEIKLLRTMATEWRPIDLLCKRLRRSEREIRAKASSEGIRVPEQISSSDKGALTKSIRGLRKNVGKLLGIVKRSSRLETLEQLNDDARKSKSILTKIAKQAERYNLPLDRFGKELVAIQSHLVEIGKILDRKLKQAFGAQKPTLESQDPWQKWRGALKTTYQMIKAFNVIILFCANVSGLIPVPIPFFVEFLGI